MMFLNFPPRTVTPKKHLCVREHGTPWELVHGWNRTFLAASLLLSTLGSVHALAEREVYLLNVPDYRWYAGCYGTATGNLFGYWDRNGFPNFYTGPTAGGLAPLNDQGANVGIRSLWVSKAGVDGRPADKPGHIDDYWAYYNGDSSYSYESTDEDPYVKLGREEHAWDCVGDFIGLSQKKWTNMNGECDGNIDAYSFVYWDATGQRRVNYTPSTDAGEPALDIQSGLRAWSEYRGYSADVMTQLASFNPETPPGQGFTFENVKAEIDAGYPLLVFLQSYDSNSRSLTKPVPMPKANPDIHAMMIFGYWDDPDEVDPIHEVRCRTSWASGNGPAAFKDWSSWAWVQFPGIQLAVRGVISYRPKPRIMEVQHGDGTLTLSWHGPSAQIYDVINRETKKLHFYVVEHSPTLHPPAFTPITDPTSELTATVNLCCGGAGYYRVKLLDPAP